MGGREAGQNLIQYGRVGGEKFSPVVLRLAAAAPASQGPVWALSTLTWRPTEAPICDVPQ